MHCKIPKPKAIEFRSKLGFNQYDITLIKEQSVVGSIMYTYEGEHMQAQHSVLDNRTELYFSDHKLTVEVDEKGYKDRSTDYELKIQKAIEKERGCEFIGINPVKFFFEISRANNEIFRLIKELIKKSTDESTKKLLVDDVRKSSEIAFKFTNNVTIFEFTEKYVRGVLPTL